MGTLGFRPEFKEEAVRQTTERGYSVTEVSYRLDVSAHSPCKWHGLSNSMKMKKHAHDLLDAKSEIMKLWAKLKRTEKEQDILKKGAQYFARVPN